jgi:hypothetical protein
MMRIKTILLLALVVASFTVSMVQAQEPLIPLPDAKDLLPSIILTAGDGADDDQYGYSIAVDGTTAIIGAPYHDAKGYENSGAVYISDYVGSSWQFSQKVVKTPNTQPNMHFGWDVDISGNTAVVGAPGTAVEYYNDGEIFILQKQNGIWSITRFESDVDSEPKFGTSVAIEGSVIAAGAPFSDDDASNQGHVNVYDLNDPSKEIGLYMGSEETEVYFGSSLDISNGRILVGAPGKEVDEADDMGTAYIYVQSGEGWVRQAELTPAMGNAEEEFGASVALDGDIALIGAPADTPDDLGAAYFFNYINNTWLEGQTLFASDLASGDRFGHAVALDGEMALIGAPLKDTMHGADSGKAYFFKRAGNTWSEDDNVIPVDYAGDAEANGSDMFGQAVALSNDRAFVGATNIDAFGYQNYGAVYTYDAGGITAPTETPTVEMTATPDATVTVEPTATSGIPTTPTPDTTKTPMPVSELIDNGGFEAQTAPWTVKNSTKDKVKCNKAGKPQISHTGNCAFVFQGNAGENSKLRQSLDLSGTLLTVDGNFNLSAYVNAARNPNAKIKLKVTYGDGTATGKRTINVTPTSGYTLLTESYTLESDAVKSARLSIDNKGTTGKVYVDDVTVVYETDVTFNLMPLP